MAPLCCIDGLQPYRVDMPDIFRVLLDRPVRREVAHGWQYSTSPHRPTLPGFDTARRRDPAVQHSYDSPPRNLVVVAKVNQRIQQVAVAPGSAGLKTPVPILRQRLVELFILLVIFSVVCNRCDVAPPPLPRCCRKIKIFSSPTCSCISTFAPHQGCR